MATKITVKQALLNKGLVADLTEAESLVLAQKVLVDGQVVRFAGSQIQNSQVLSLVAGKKYYSRAGEKLEFALNQFEISVSGKICADVGASTGGFTGVLLKEGASKVFAIDVARGEIAWKLRSDPRVILMERTNARELKALPETIDFVSIDVSFISVSLILPNVKNWIRENSQVIVLVKPQFEAPRDLVEAGGIIRNKNTHLLVLKNFFESAQRSGFKFNKLCRSPIEGSEGNREFLALLSLSGANIDEKFFSETVELDRIDFLYSN